LNLPFFIARRYLTRQKGGFSSYIIRLAIIATALSVAVMIISLATVDGYKRAIREKMYSFLGHIHVETGDVNHGISLYADGTRTDQRLIDYISALPHVRQVAPFIQKPAIIQVHGQIEGIFFKGVDNKYQAPSSVTFTGKKIDFSDTAYAHQIILSQATADKLNVQAGDTVQVNFIEKNSMFPRIRKVQIAGLYHTGMNEEIDRRYAICDIRLLQRVNNKRPDEISGYQVDLTEEQYVDSVNNKIYEHLKTPQYIHSALTSYTMNDIFPSIFDWLGLLDVNVRVILIIMAIVAIINLASVLMILIVEQSRMVGLLKALGMQFRSIQYIFLYHAGIIAGWGIVAGNLLALALCWLQVKTGFLKLSEDSYSIKEVAIHIYWWQIVLVDIATLVICMLCMLLPTLYVKRIKPVRVLQFK